MSNQDHSRVNRRWDLRWRHGCRHNWKTIGLIMLSFLLPFAQFAQAEHYALLIGVRQYIPTELTDLKYTENDVVKLAEVLRQRGYQPDNIVLMTQTTGADRAGLLPTSDNIRHQLKLLLAGLDRSDTILIAVSGHGVQFLGEEVDYFCPMDAKLADRSTLVSLKEIYDQLDACGAAGKLLLVDACRDDPQTDLSKSTKKIELEPVHEKRPSVVVEGGAIALKSCSRTQQSFEDPRLEHGIFFYHLIEGFKGAADLDGDGEITVSELESHTTKRVKDYARSQLGVLQIPSRFSRGEVQGDIIVAIKVESKNPGMLITPKVESRVPGILTAPFTAGEASIGQLRWAEHLGVEPVTTNSIEMKLVLIPPGEFMMGAADSDKEAYYGYEKPQHRVTISRPFYMGETEVTQGQWKAVMGTEPWKGEEYVKEGTNYPATYVSWEDAVEYCRRLSERDGREYRLPTEAEWEYACRGGSTGRYSFGDDVSELGRYAWFDENAWNKDEKYAHLVRQKLANPFGLFDMHGNVYEWCSDWYGEKYYGESPSADPTGPNDGESRVRRGGGWSNIAWFSRSAFRSRDTPTFRNNLLGFRLVSVISE